MSMVSVVVVCEMLAIWMSARAGSSGSVLTTSSADSCPMAGCDRAEESNRFYVAITRVRDELSLYVPAAAERVSPFVEAMQVGKAVARGRLQVDAHF